MKKFKLIIKNGRKIIYESIFSYTPSQEAAYLKKLVETAGNQMESEIQDVLIRTIGEKAWRKEHKKWEGDMKIRDYAEHYPDITIAAGIQDSLYEAGLFPDLENLANVNCTDSEEVLAYTMPSIGWTCNRVS